MEAEMQHSEISSNYLNFKKKKTHNKPQQKNKKVFIHISRVAVLFVFCAVAKTTKKYALWEFW